MALNWKTNDHFRVRILTFDLPVTSRFFSRITVHDHTLPRSLDLSSDDGVERINASRDTVALPATSQFGKAIASFPVARMTRFH